VKNHVLKEIILDSMKDILSQNLGIEETYISIKRLFILDEFELKVLLNSVGKIKQKQVDEKRMELLR
jgi:hypothetical protein